MPASPAAHKPLNCPQCGKPMDALALEGHYGNTVHTDVCAPCRLAWLDEFEAVNLSGLGWVRLLRRLQNAQLAAQGATAGPLAAQVGCPRCGAGLTAVHNLTGMGRFGELECPRCRGGLASFALLLARRGLVRAMTRRDLDALKAERRDPACLNCGAALEREACARGLLDRDARCRYCASPLVVVDMPRFFTALLTRHAEPLAATHLAWPCRACGAPVEPTQGAACRDCGHPVVVPSLIDLTPLLNHAEPLLRGQAGRGARAHGSRLREQRGDYRATALYRVLIRLRDIMF